MRYLGFPIRFPDVKRERRRFRENPMTARRKVLLAALSATVLIGAGPAPAAAVREVLDPARATAVRPAADGAPDGFASVAALGLSGTTGGVGGPTVTVDTTD